MRHQGRVVLVHQGRYPRGRGARLIGMLLLFGGLIAAAVCYVGAVKAMQATGASGTLDKPLTRSGQEWRVIVFFGSLTVAGFGLVLALVGMLIERTSRFLRAE